MENLFLQELSADLSLADQIAAAEKIVKQMEAKVKHDTDILKGMTHKDPVKVAELAALKAKL